MFGVDGMAPLSVEQEKQVGELAVSWRLRERLHIFYRTLLRQKVPPNVLPVPKELL